MTISELKLLSPALSLLDILGERGPGTNWDPWACFTFLLIFVNEVLLAYRFTANGYFCVTTAKLSGWDYSKDKNIYHLALYKYCQSLLFSRSPAGLQLTM